MGATFWQNRETKADTKEVVPSSILDCYDLRTRRAVYCRVVPPAQSTIRLKEAVRQAKTEHERNEIQISNEDCEKEINEQKGLYEFCLKLGEQVISRTAFSF